MRLAHSNLPPFCSLIICCASIHDVECKSWGLLEPQLFPQNDCSTNQTTVQTCAALCQSREEIVLGKTSKSCRVQERKAFCKCVARGNTKSGKQRGEKNNLMHQQLMRTSAIAVMWNGTMVFKGFALLVNHKITCQAYQNADANT